MTSRRVSLVAALAAFTIVAAAAAQLDSTCMVSAFNRTAPVQADGTWVLPNVPANVGQVRVRATCVENGAVRFGASTLITVPENGVIKIDEIEFQGPPPVPSSLELTAPVTTLGAVGETVQLIARARFPDGSTPDVTSSAAGTDYRISNSAIATVSADGLVTARASGIALVSAVNEGALGILRIQVVASGDSDGDGLPDDFEIANGLDPNNPLDALDDQDGDGISTLDEVQAGLDPLKPDTDGDRLRDGEEAAYGTNPLLFDSDGDGVSDGLEVTAGSDPTDGNSVDLGPILTSLTVRPASFTLVFNPVLGEASRRLDVVARLIDGTEIEARSRRYGTTYQSSHLTIANFGPEDGVVYAGQNGNATVTARIGTVSGSCAVKVETFNPTDLAFLLLPGSANGVAVSGDLAFVASGAAGLHLVDVSNLAAPVLVATVDTPGNANDVRVEGGYAYVADGVAGLQIVDVGDPGQARIVGTRDTPGVATDLVVKGDRVYVADGPAGVQVIDVSDRSQPLRLGGVDTPGLARGIDAVDDLVVVADGSGGVHVVSVANPAAPVILGSTHTRVTWSRAADVAVRGRLAWVADGADRTLGGLRVIDFSAPATPAVVGRTSDSFGLAGVALDRGAALAADYFFVNGVPIFDADTSPAYVALLDFSGPPGPRDDNGNGIAVRGDGAVFLAATNDIEDNGVSASGGLHIGLYRFEGDDLGVAPEVAVTLPAAGSAARERTVLSLRAEATDDVRVESVGFLLDGVEVFRDFKRPFEAKVTVPIGSASIRIGALAADMAGNVGTAGEVVVAVIPDDKPVVTLLSPAPGVTVREGGRGEVVALVTDDVQVSSVRFYLDGSLVLTSNRAPYRYDFPVLPGATQVVVQVVATDNQGQTGSASLIVPVEDDPPPFVAVVSPVDGAQVVEYSQVRVIVGATDDLGIAHVELQVNGEPAGFDFAPPYELSFGAPPAGSPLQLSAIAEDTLGQRSSVTIDLVVAPDPLTTVVGRVLDDQGHPVSGATVGCRSTFILTDEQGRFSFADLSFSEGVVLCTAEFVSPSGRFWRLSSAPRNPVAGGITDMGDLRPAPYLLYVAAGDSGNVSLVNADTLEGGALEATEIDGGITGLALDSAAGHLYATTIEGEPGSRVSRLLELDPGSGAVTGTPRPIVDAAGGAPLGLGDLAIQPGTGILFGLRSWEDGGNQAGALYVLDPVTGIATRRGQAGTDGYGGLAFATDGTLYATRWDSDEVRNVLVALDPADGTTLSEVQIDSSAGVIHGLSSRPQDGLLLAALEQFSESHSKPQEIVILDPATGLSTSIGYTQIGKLEDLEVFPLPPPAGQTTVAGRLIDDVGAPVEGLRVQVRSLYEAVSGSDGRFAIPGVPAIFDPVVVEVLSSDFSASGAASSPTATVAAGTTEVGDIVVVADDPKTTAAGRVLDGAGNPVAGARLSCQGSDGTSEPDGTFSLSGVTVLDGVVLCAARFTTPQGELLTALSAPVAPVSRGVTEVGDLRPSSSLVYVSYLVSAFSTPGNLSILNADSLRGSFFAASGTDDLGGLASDSLGRLYATTLEGPPESRTSRLLQLDPGTGGVLSEIGPVTGGPGGAPLSVGDLAVQPGTDALFALRTEEDGLGQAGGLYEIDRVTGVASLVGGTATDGNGGLAFTPDGALYTTRWDETTASSFLRGLDPATGASLSERTLTGVYGAYSGLAARPENGTLYAAPRDYIGYIVAVDPASGAGALFGAPLYGVVGDLAFQPSPPPGERTTVVGRVLDGAGAPLAGALVSVRGVFQSVSGSDGRFVVSGVPSSFGEIVATAGVGRECDECTLQNSAESAPTPAVAGGTTDVGDIVLADINRPTTVSGTVVDELGEPVPGAAIKIYNNSVIVTAIADAAGAYSVANVASDDPLSVVATAQVGGVALRGQEGAYPVPLGVTEVPPIVVSPREELPDPLTTVTGRVADESGQAVAGARVHVFTDWDVFPVTSGADGRFSIPGVPTVDGEIRASATVRRAGRLETGGSNSVPPEPGGTTDLGSFQIQPQNPGGGVELAPAEGRRAEELAALPLSSLDPIVSWVAERNRSAQSASGGVQELSW